MTVKVSKEEFKFNGNVGIFEAFALAQAEFEPVIFDRVNPHFKSRYATLVAIRKATQPALGKYGLAATQPWTHLENGDIVLYTNILHKSGEQIVSSCLITKGNKTDQQLGASITYVRRYQLASVLGVCAEEEDDGEVERKEDEKQKLEVEKERLQKLCFMDKKKVGELEFRLSYLPKEMLPKMLEIAQVKSLWDFSEAMYDSAIKTLDKQIESLKTTK